MDAKIESKQLCLFDVSEFRFDEWHHNDPELTLPPADAIALKEGTETQGEGEQLGEC